MRHNMNWKDELRLLKLESIKRSTPAAFEASGGYDYKVKPYTDKDANGLTRCILDFINFNTEIPGTATRINTQGQRRMIKGRERWVKGTTRRGTADIIGTICGVYVAIEIKIGRDKQREQQLKEQARIEKAGGKYFIAKDFPGFRQWYADQFENRVLNNIRAQINKGHSSYAAVELPVNNRE